MKTKRVKVYIDLYPHWQDSPNWSPCFMTSPTYPPMEGFQRYEVIVDLPRINPSVETVEATVVNKVEESQ